MRMKIFENRKNCTDRHYHLVLSELNKISAKKNKKLLLLEVGAGEGILKDNLPKNIIYYSLDTRGEPDYKFDLNKGQLPIKSETFDLLICLETLEHVYYPDKVIEELKRVTKNDGILIFSMPNEYNFWLRLMYLFAIKKDDSDKPFTVVSDYRHIHKPRVKDILDIFSKHFMIKKVEYLWQSRRCKDYKWAFIIDNFINLLAQVCPTLFARLVIIFAKKKNN